MRPGLAEWAPVTTVLAAAAAEQAGFLVGRLLTVALAVLLVVWGTRLRRRGRTGAGIAAIVVGALLALGLLASIAGGASTAP
ncbi:hypothetical protein GCM10011381_04810 [Klenkia taihuensis]|uniref:Uncharacterized protein n=1 Tax=Klenkia taihuensis TaxID=1225127 RepID=A0A1I1QXB8_9ACTN|nr:hypothetical protein GCM10011381_04810 [Klenkia taihuensis]SFD23923.1 hypothetical protein SAMN05661030_2888 [Klenkia taihuensis]